MIPSGKPGISTISLSGYRNWGWPPGWSLASMTSVVKPRWAVVRLGGEPGRAGADDDDVPVRELIDVGDCLLFDHFVIAHRNAFALLAADSLWRDPLSFLCRHSRAERAAGPACSRNSFSISRTSRVVFRTASGLSEMLSIPCSTRNSGELGIVAGRLAADADLAALGLRRRESPARSSL